jgi:type I restriction enzyme S subunit
MQEYRTRLTSDIVTGKLDVHDVAAKLPDAPEGSTGAEAETENAVEEDLEREEASP